MVYCSKYVKAGLDENRLLRKRYLQRQKALMKYDKMTLRICIKNGRAYYYGKKKGKEVYLGSAENETVRGIRELRFCRAMLEVLEKNIKAMEAFLEKYSSPSAAAVKAALPKHYRPTRPTEYALHPEKNPIWQRFRAMQAHKAKIPVHYPENLKILTFDGTAVRSRVEALLYERFSAAGFYVIYEYPIEYAPGKFIRPDFLLIHPETGAIFLWEHLGLWYHETSSEFYRNEFNGKTDIYRNLGFIPGVNLLMSFETPLGLDMERIAQEVDHLYNLEETAQSIKIAELQQAQFADFSLLKVV